MARVEKPFPPGRYPLVIVGSGPGALQTSYFLRRHRIRHAVISADRGPGGMFRRFPFFDRLISWSKPFPPTDAGALAYERFDWNSLLSDNARHTGLVRKEMDGTSYFPRRSEMERGLVKFADATNLTVRYGCRWEGTRRLNGSYVLDTSDGEYEAPVVVFGIGVTEPWTPDIPGARHVVHYVDLKKPRDYAGKRVLILGKRNSGFETAHGLLPWASRIVMASPSPVTFSITARHPSAARAVYMQPYEDYVLGGGHYVLDAAPTGIERTARALRVHLEGTTEAQSWVFEVDEVIAATGFQTPLLDLPGVGVTTFGHQRFPALTPFWESSTAPGIYFVGSTTQGAPGLKKFGRASNSGVVNGFRHNARILAAHLAATRWGRQIAGTTIRRRDIPNHLLNCACEDGALWNQQAYLARVVRLPGRGPGVDVGLQPLTHFLDSSNEAAVAITVETDPDGLIRPVAYVRGTKRCSEHALETAPLLDFRTKSNRAMLRALIESM
jgi:thioredoxin reductase